MKRSKKAALIVAAILFACGAVLSAVGLSMGVGAEKTYGPSAECQESSATVSDAFSCVTVNTDECDVAFLQSTDGVCRVVCYAPKGVECVVTVEDGTMTVRELDTRQRYEKWSIWGERVHMEIYLPTMTGEDLSVTTDTGDVALPSWLPFTTATVTTDTGDVEVRGTVVPTALLISTETGNVTLQTCESRMLNVTTDTGDVLISECTMQSIRLHTNTGDVEVCDSNAEQLGIASNTGDITCEAVILQGDVTLTSDTGDVTLADCHSDTLGAHTGTGDVQLRRSVAGHVGITTDAGDVALQAVGAEDMEIETVTGNVTGTLLSDKEFEVKTSTGDVKVPASVAGAGKCSVTTSTGDIDIRITK